MSESVVACRINYFSGSIFECMGRQMGAQHASTCSHSQRVMCIDHSVES